MTKRRIKTFLLFSATAAASFALFWMCAPLCFGEPGARISIAVCALAAIGVGSLGWLISFWIGPGFGLAIALVAAASPWVWNGALTGDIRIAVGGALLFALVFAQTIVLWLLTSRDHYSDDIDEAQRMVETRLPWTDLTGHERSRVAVQWVVLVASLGLVALEVWMHDWHYGRISRIYSEGVATEASGRWVFSNGVIDECLPPRGKTAPSLKLMSFGDDEEYRSRLMEVVKADCSGDAELAMAAKVSGKALAMAGVVRRPDVFFTLDGRSTTEQGWTGRWQALKPFVESSDPMVVKIRRAMGVEGRGLANRLFDAGDSDAAERVRRMVAEEVMRGVPAPDYRAEKHRVAPETIAGWSVAMTNAVNRGALDEAGGIARRILDEPGWMAYVPANEVMGIVSANLGDYAVSESFYRKALALTPRPGFRLCDHFADTLLHLNKFKEAEQFARKAVMLAPNGNWQVRQTLLRVLERRPDADRKEVSELRGEIGRLMKGE